MDSGLADLTEAEVQKFAAHFERLFNERNPAAMAAYYTHDARIMAQDADVSGGTPALEAFWRQACAHQAIKQRTIQVTKVDRAEDMGYVLSVVTLRLELPHDQARTLKINDVTVWKRGRHGRWNIALDFAGQPQSIDES